MEMRNLTDSEIEEYVALDKPLESCGAYKFEANGFKLFKSVGKACKREPYNEKNTNYSPINVITIIVR